MQQIVIDNRICNVHAKGKKAPVFIYVNAPSIPFGAKQIAEAFEKINNKDDYIFIEIYIDDWDKNLSPWAIKTINNREFAGDGPQTLKWIINNIIPYINQFYNEHEDIYLTGYSLSGLFALWSLYNSDVFDGALCCSGSLWFPQWDEYALNNRIKKKSLVYLSLGGKEEKTKNPLMASVGDNTRNQLKILKNNPLIKSVILEMNPGGHFADTAMRVAKGINWVFKEKEYLCHIRHC